MILDNLQRGDWVMIKRAKFECDLWPSGIPLYVMGVSLPWLSVIPACAPDQLNTLSTEYYELSEVSENYVESFLMIYSEGWQKLRNHLSEFHKHWKEQNNAESTKHNPNSIRDVGTDSVSPTD